MEREEILKDIQKFFNIQELVCPHVFQTFGESAWRFLDSEFLHTLLILRKDVFKTPMYCNGGNFTQRGLRCNLCELVSSKEKPYISAHILGKAGDFDVKGLTAEQARQKIKEIGNLLPYPVRVESVVNWLHFDVMPHNGSNKVYFFKG